MAYITTTDVELAGGLPATDTGDSDLISVCITRAQKFIEEYTGRVFESTTDLFPATRYFTAAIDVDGPWLFLDNDLHTVGSDGITAGTDSIASTDYTTRPVNEKPYYALVLTDNCPHTWDDPTSDADYENAISIAGEWCYSTSAPADIQHACVRLTRWYYEQYKITPQEDRAVVLESGVTVYPATIPKDVLDILNYYKKWVAYG